MNDHLRPHGAPRPIPGGGGLRRTARLLALASLAPAGAGCSEGDASKSWATLSACLAGAAAQKPLVERTRALRQVQLANASTAKDAWPARCAPYADELYTALAGSGQNEILKRELGARLGCREEKGTCAMPPSDALMSTLIELWDAAKDSGLEPAEPAAGLRLPDAGAPPLLDAPGWKGLSQKPKKVAGPVLTPDGRAVLLLKPAEGRARPVGCEFTEDLSKVQCSEANAAMPELPAHTLEIAAGPSGVFAAGLSEKGMVSYDLKTGEPSDVRGSGRRLVRDGVAVERGTKEDVSAAPDPTAAPTVKEEGFVVVEIKGGKAGRELKLPIDAPIGDPIALGNQIVALRRTEAGAELVVKALSRGRLKDVTTLQGGFSGALHSCQSGDELAVASFAGRAGLPSAKPTGGAGKTSVSLALHRGGSWSKALEATLPFERASESELVCNKAGASLAWVANSEGGVEVGRLDCSPEACKTSSAKLPGVESKWWWTVTPLGEKVAMLWRSSLGETRARIAPLSELANAKDVILFEAPDFGGPNAGELTTLATERGALLVFRGEQAVALHIAGTGSLRLIAP